MKYLGIPMTIETYDDEVALCAYTFRHFAHLLTPLERRVTEYTAPVVSDSEHLKVRRVYDFLEQRDGHVSDEDVVEACKVPYDARKRSALIRVISEHRHAINENRCPECNRLVRTPAARQCLWCGHDWH